MLEVNYGSFNQTVPDLQTISVSLDVTETARVRDLVIRVDLLHTYIGDLQVTLVPPAERSLPNVLLHDRSGGSKNNIRRSFDAVTTPGLAAFRGIDPSGSWTLRVSDQVEQDSGTLVEFGLEFSFEAAPTVRTPRAATPRAAPAELEPAE